MDMARRNVALSRNARASLTAAFGVFVLALSACASADQLGADDSRGAAPGSSPQVVSGEEALSLYGITPGPSAESTPTVTAEAWFPRQVWVSASVLPYDDTSPIRILPVYSDPELDRTGTWLGDLPEGASVTLRIVDATGRACLVDGAAAQGWQVRGWVACNRILFFEPTLVPDG